MFCPARFRKWQGSNLKIEISSFHQSFSFCYNKIACYLVFSILKITPLSPPPTGGRVVAGWLAFKIPIYKCVERKSLNRNIENFCVVLHLFPPSFKRSTRSPPPQYFFFFLFLLLMNLAIPCMHLPTCHVKYLFSQNKTVKPKPPLYRKFEKYDL